MTIPGFPDNVTALAYRPATAEEHWFEPSGSDAPGLLHPGPTSGVVLVVVAASGHSLRYDIGSDTTFVVVDEAIPTAPEADTPLVTREHNYKDFGIISSLLLNGTAKKAARALWHSGRCITSEAAYAPHFITETGRIWAFRCDDLRARDWYVVA